MEFISERVANISELEQHIRIAYEAVGLARYEIGEEKPRLETLKMLLKQAHVELLQAKDFEFCIERRREREK